MFDQFYIILAALLWGVTNPFLKRFTEGFETEKNQQTSTNNQNQNNKKKNNTTTVDGKNKSVNDDKDNNGGGGFLRDIKFLLSRPKYLMTQALNLSGTVVFNYSLSFTDVSVAAVATNALALVVTCIVSAAIGDSVLKPKGMLGILFVIIGLGFCTYEAELKKKQQQVQEI